MSHSSWEEALYDAHLALDTKYKKFLEDDLGYFPKKKDYLNAFKTLPKNKVKYILFGQDPYPREQSAGGYAFIDKQVKNLFCARGLSKEVNRASSLRNFIKMALVARQSLDASDTSQEAISALDKTKLVDNMEALRENFQKNAVLLLNTALIFTDKKDSAKHIRAWRPFMQSLLKALKKDAPKLILFGRHAKALRKHLPLEHFECIELEHPYNHTFITNKKAHELFAGMRLLEK